MPPLAKVKGQVERGSVEMALVVSLPSLGISGVPCPISPNTFRSPKLGLQRSLVAHKYVCVCVCVCVCLCVCVCVCVCISGTVTVVPTQWVFKGRCHCCLIWVRWMSRRLGYVRYFRKALEKGYLEHQGLHTILTICLRFSSVLDGA